MGTTPHRLGRYELLQHLGRGSVGEVWKAYDHSQRRDVAIKVFYTDLQRSEQNFLTRLTNEGQALVELHHTNIVQVHEIKVARSPQSQETNAYLAMNYVEGQTLSDYIRATSHRGIFPPLAEIIYLFTSIGVAIDYAHQQGIVHGNIKPGNILLNQHQTAHFPAGEPQLTDFGLTQLAGLAVDSAIPLYVSPEQAQGSPAHARSDIYALGVMLYELCTGIVPFRDESSVAVMMKHIHTLPTPPILINPNIPPALSEVILRAMAKDPITRFSLASLLAAAIADASTQPHTLYVGNQQGLEEESPSSSSSLPILGVAQPQHSGPLPARQLKGFPYRATDAAQASSISQPLLAIPPIPPASSVSAPHPRVTAQQPALQSGEPAYSDRQSSPRTLPPQLPAPRSSNTVQFSATPMPSERISQPLSMETTPVQVPRPPAQTFYPPAPVTMPPQSARHPYQVPEYPAEQVSFPSPMPVPLPLPTPKRSLFGQVPNYVPVLSLILVVLLIGGAIGVNQLLNKAPVTTVAGHVFFQDDALGQNDQLYIDMQNGTAPAAGKVYFAWLLDDAQHLRPLGALSTRNGQQSLLYMGDTQHTNLLSLAQGFLITQENAGGNPTMPSAQKVYQGNFDAEMLKYLRNILYTTPGLPDKQGVLFKLLDTIRSMEDKVNSINDSLGTDPGLVMRQASRVIDMLDGSQYAASSGDRPAKVPSLMNAQVGLLSHPAQKGYVDVLGDQLTQLKQVAADSAILLQHTQNVQNALTDLQDWLQKIRGYDVQILKAADLHDPVIIGVALQLKQTAADSYTGRTIPPNTGPQPVLGSAGAYQAYTEAQYLAALDLHAV